MGNCCRSASSSAVWAGDDWGSLVHNKHQLTMFGGADDNEKQGTNTERQRPLGTSSSSSGSTRDQVKIKITKRELEEIMARVNLQELSPEQVLARLIDSSSDHNFEMEHSHMHWKPVLQSIPEVN